MAANPTAGYDDEWTDDPGWGPEDFVPIVYYNLVVRAAWPTAEVYKSALRHKAD